MKAPRWAFSFGVCVAMLACGRGKQHGSAGAGASPAGAVGAPNVAAAAPKGRCPATGMWAQCSILDRLDHSGLAPRLDSATVDEPPLTRKGRLVRLGSAELELFLYPDSVSRKADEARLDRKKFIDASQEPSLAGERTLIRSANLLAILSSRNDHQRERVSDAITAGPPQP